MKTLHVLAVSTSNVIGTSLMFPIGLVQNKCLYYKLLGECISIIVYKIHCACESDFKNIAKIKCLVRYSFKITNKLLILL